MIYLEKLLPINILVGRENNIERLFYKIRKNVSLTNFIVSDKLIEINFETFKNNFGWQFIDRNENILIMIQRSFHDEFIDDIPNIWNLILEKTNLFPKLKIIFGTQSWDFLSYISNYRFKENDEIHKLSVIKTENNGSTIFIGEILLSLRDYRRINFNLENPVVKKCIFDLEEV